ncbi:hypothetical protein BGX30_002899 [Mortierella sp. GBA39]|nr:hypothetical protein BGX30_002899 [Mortierella sp. GBA39]
MLMLYRSHSRLSIPLSLLPSVDRFPQATPGCQRIRTPRISLANLRYLRLPDKYRGYHADQICSFLEQSPQLESWYVPCIAESADIKAITRTIRTHCKKEFYNGMPYANYKGKFVIQGLGMQGSSASYDLHTRPFCYSDSDLPQWAMFERLCLHTGSLQQLKILDLRGAAAVVDTTYNPPQEIDYSKLTFPGLLRLGDASTREPGYESLLKDLRQLKTFRGLVWLNYVRAQERIGQAKVEWMYENWPLLLLVEFLDYTNQSALEERAYLK